jgi:hypothetical protein
MHHGPEEREQGKQMHPTGDPRCLTPTLGETPGCFGLLKSALKSLVELICKVRRCALRCLILRMHGLKNFFTMRVANFG